MKRFAVLLITLMALSVQAHAQFSGGGGTSNVGNYIDPTFLYGADTTGTATTGTITTGTNSLSVASAASWSVGQGIAVHNAGAGGNTELITTVTAISGTTFTLAANASATATTQAVNHDDTAALTSAISLATSSGRPIRAPCGLYNVTSVLTVALPISFFGVGTACVVIQNRGTTNDIFDITYNDTSFPTTGGVGSVFEDFTIVQASGITPSAGYGIDVNVPTSACSAGYLTALNINRVNIQYTYGGLNIGAGALQNFYSHITVYSTGAGQGFVYNVPEPCGDNSVSDVLMGGNSTTGLTITQADTTLFTNIKLNNGSKILFNPSAAANVGRVRFVNASIEGTSGPFSGCGIDFGSTGIYSATFVGGGIGGYTTPICNVANAGNTSFSGMLYYPTLGGTNSILNALYPAPVFSGCGTNGTATGSAQSGTVTMTCAAATMVMTLPAAPTGWKCDVRDLSTTTDLIAQSANSATTATFASTTTGSAATLVYSCTSW